MKNATKKTRGAKKPKNPTRAELTKFAKAAAEMARRYDDAGNDLSTVEGTQRSCEASAVAEAASKARSAELAKKIRALVGEYDAEEKFLPVSEVSHLFDYLEANLISAAGLVATYMVDEAPTEADTAEALRQLAQARGNLAATRSHLEDAGILATGGGEMAAE